MKRLTEAHIKINDFNRILGFVICSKSISDTSFEVISNWLLKNIDCYRWKDFLSRCNKKFPDEVAKNIFATLLNKKNFPVIYDFGTYMQNSVFYGNIFPWEEFTDSIVESKSFVIIYNAGLMQNTNKLKLITFFIEMNSLKMVYAFVKNIKDIPNDAITNIVSFVESTNCPEFIYLFLRNIPLSIGNMLTLTKALIKTEDVKYINYFLLSLGTRNDEQIEIIKELLMKFINENNDRDWMRNYNPDIHQELEETLLNSDDSIQNPFVDVPEQDKMMNLQA